MTGSGLDQTGECLSFDARIVAVRFDLSIMDWTKIRKCKREFGREE